MRATGDDVAQFGARPYPLLAGMASMSVLATKQPREIHMKGLVALALILGFSVAAQAEPVKLSKEKMATITAGAITAVTTQLNGGGNTPKGTANGVPIITTNVNPAGKAPAGQN